jgi:hypothetical protein
VKIQAFRNSVKRKAIDDICEKPAKIINQGLAESPRVLNLINTKDVSNLRKCLYRKRRSQFPKLPTDIFEAQRTIDILNPQTCKKENFLLANCYESNIVIFSCVTNLTFLSSCTTLYMDGTFDYAPKHFVQMFTIHGIKNGHYVPLVFCLLPNKSKESYSKTFDIIKSKCTMLRLNFEPREVVVDFEESIHKAVREMWPNVKLIGCRFHLSQSWIRKIKKLGLISEYMDRGSKIGQFLNSIFGLTFLEPESVGDCFAFDLIATENVNDSRLTAFLDYLTENYIQEDARFPPEIWASASVTSERTTNCCESFHSQFNKSFYCPHPNILQFIYILSQNQTNVYVKLNSINLPKKITNKKYRDRLIFLRDLLIKYQNQSISRIHFVRAASFHYNKLS